MILSMLDYPRSTTRQRWHEIWSLRRRLKRTEGKIRQRLLAILDHEPDIPDQIRDDITYRITNPVLFAWPEP